MDARIEHQLDQRADPLEQSLTAFTDLNRRIARLALALHLNLGQEDTVERVMQLDLPAPESEDELEQAPRLRREWTELRALLVMRYQLERELTRTHGAQVMHRVLDTAEARLERAGFRHGQDGIDLDLEHLFHPAAAQAPVSAG